MEQKPNKQQPKSHKDKHSVSGIAIGLAIGVAIGLVIGAGLNIMKKRMQSASQLP